MEFTRTRLADVDYLAMNHLIAASTALTLKETSKAELQKLSAMGIQTGTTELSAKRHAKKSME